MRLLDVASLTYMSRQCCYLTMDPLTPAIRHKTNHHITVYMTHLFKIMHRSAQAPFCDAAAGESFVMLQPLFVLCVFNPMISVRHFVCLPLTCREIGTDINFLLAVRSCRGWDRAVWWCGQFYTFPFYSTRPFSKPLHTQLHCKKKG
jgi:hypothetical protein